MDSSSLETTNLILGIMAAVSVLEGLLILGLGFAGWKAYRSVMEIVNGLETRHVAPTMARVNRMLDDLGTVTTTVKDETERVDQAIHRTLERVDDTANRVRSNIVAKTSRVVGAVRGARVAIETLLGDRQPRPQEPRTAGREL
jgi:hypothetical protein